MATRTRIGRFQVEAFVDYAPPPFNPLDFFPDVTERDWEPHRAHHALDEDGKFRTNFGAFVIRSEDSLVLVDTGIGPGVGDAFKSGGGRLPQQLARMGVNPESVTAVVTTHLHGDHVGWNLTDGELTFPNARYVVSQTDWDHWTEKNVLEKSAHIRSQAIPLRELGVLDLSADGYQVAPGLRVVATPGHTPGHQSLLIESDGDRGLIMGDIIHSRAQINQPEWCAGFDMDKPTAIATRKRVIEQAVRENMTLAAGHLLLDTNIGHVVEVKGQRYWSVL